MRPTPFYAPDGMAGYGGDQDRFAGVRRDYTPGDVDRLAGTVRIRHTLAEMGAARLWRLLMSEPFVPAVGAITGDQAFENVKAGLKAVYLPQSTASGESGPQTVRSINDALRECDQIAQSGPGRDGTTWMAPVITDAEAVYGGPLNAYELTRNLIAAGAAGVRFDDRLATEKRAGHASGNVLVPISQHIRTLNAARLAADVEGVNTVLLCRTNAQSAQMLTSDVDERDRPFIGNDRTAEGFFRIRPGCGDDYAIARALAYAPYTDLLWWETTEPDLRAAERFANEIHKRFPDKMLAFNASPSFNRRTKLAAGKISAFRHEIARMGYRLQFVSLAAFHGLDLSSFNCASGYRERGMEEYNELRQIDTDGYTESGISYFDAAETAMSGGGSSANAFAATGKLRDYGIVHAHDRHDEGLVHNHHWAVSDACAGSTEPSQFHDYGIVQAHERDDDGLVHSHGWAASGAFAASKARFYDYSAVHAHDRHDDGLVHNHAWAVSGK